MNRRKFIKLLSMTWAAVALLPVRFCAQAEKVKVWTYEHFATIGYRSRHNLAGNMGTDPIPSKIV